MQNDLSVHASLELCMNFSTLKYSCTDLRHHINIIIQANNQCFSSAIEIKRKRRKQREMKKQMKFCFVRFPALHRACNHMCYQQALIKKGCKDISNNTPGMCC